GLSFTQEFRSSRAAEKLKAMVSNTATVTRRASDGHSERIEVPVAELGAGDIVHLSAGLLQHGRQGPMPGVWEDIERLVEASAATSTFVRAGGFAANTLGWSDGIRAHGIVRMTFPDAARSLVHERDIAEVSVHALLEPEHRGRAYDVTGPAVLTQADQVTFIANAVGREIRIEEQAPEEAVAEADPAVRDMVQASLTHWATLVDDPELARDDVERVTGHPPRTFEQWAQDHVLDFATLSTAEVAQNYASGFRSGDITRSTALLAPDVVRIAPLETDGEHREVRGLESIMENAAQQNADVDIEGVEVSEPFVGDSQFAIRFDFVELHRPTMRRQTTTKMSLCTVRASRIVREEVFYHSPPHA
ncbi:MAG: hypothetical protein L0K86_10705, partial [Actinomycetia bacterium]|nr:hypothetical protein [Actinomycetes bacterium]